MIVERNRWLGAGAAAVVLAGSAVAIARGASRDHHIVASPPLSAAERRELVAVRPLINRLGAAVDQVSVAAHDLSGGKVSVASASTRVAGTPALHDLATAGPTITLISSAYQGAVSGGTIPEVDRLSVAVNELSAIEGELLPAVRVGATTGTAPPAASAALEAIESDRHAPDLAVVVRSWPQIYGALTLVEQAAPQS